jgi:hypothetical protein
MEGLTMKKFGFIIATILLSSNVVAGVTVAAPKPNLAIAVLETGAALDRPALEVPRADNQNHQEERFVKRARQLNKEIGNRVEQRLQEKLELQLKREF